MNIVLDTNCLIISIAPKSPYRKVWDAFLRGDYNLCSEKAPTELDAN